MTQGAGAVDAETVIEADAGADRLHREARFSFINWLFIGFTIAAVVAVVRDLGASHWYALLHAVLYAMGLAGFVLRRSARRTAVWLMLGASYLLGASGLGGFGVDGANLLLLTLATLGACVLLGDRVGRWSAFMCFATLGAYMAAAYPSSANLDEALLGKWRSDVTGAAAAAAMIAMLVGLVRFARRRMARLFAIQSQQARQLRQLVKALDASNQRLHALNDQLEEQVRARTSDLEAFAYTVAHDLRAPLRTIDAFAQMLTPRHDLPDAALVCVDRIREGVSHAMQITSSVLRLLGLNYTDRPAGGVNLSDMARAIIADLRVADPVRNVAVQIQYELKAFGDAALIQQLLQNLIGNAWKFTAQTAGPRIAIGALQEGGQIVFYVRDNGAGFDARQKEKLFSPFQRLHDAEEFAGTGVGLATVKRIVQLHGGRIWAQGELGRGATFFFTLPGAPPESSACSTVEDAGLDVTQPMRAPRRAEPAHGKAGAPAHSRAERVLAELRESAG